MNKTSKEAVLYVSTAMIGNVIDFGIFSSLNGAGIGIVTAQWIAALIGNTHNFLWQFFSIFDHNQEIKKTYAETIFLAASLIVISGPLLSALNSLLENATISKLILFPIIGTIGFLARKYLIFVKK